MFVPKILYMKDGEVADTKQLEPVATKEDAAKAVDTHFRGLKGEDILKYDLFKVEVEDSDVQE